MDRVTAFDTINHYLLEMNTKQLAEALALVEYIASPRARDLIEVSPKTPRVRRDAVSAFENPYLCLAGVRR